MVDVSETSNAVELLGSRFTQEAYQQCVNITDDALDEKSTGKLSLHDFEVIGNLGHGSFSSVELIRHVQSSNLYAVKCLSKYRLSRLNKIDAVFKEKQIMFNLKHSGIVRLRWTFQDEHSLYMVMDLCANGDLSDMICEGVCLSLQDARDYTNELVDIVCYLHEHNVVHRDIKPENLLFDSLWHMKLGDFGCAKQLARSASTGRRERAVSFVGSIGYLPPEMIGAITAAKVAARRADEACSPPPAEQILQSAPTSSRSITEDLVSSGHHRHHRHGHHHHHRHHHRHYNNDNDNTNSKSNTNTNTNNNNNGGGGTTSPASRHLSSQHIVRHHHYVSDRQHSQSQRTASRDELFKSCVTDNDMRHSSSSGAGSGAGSGSSGSGSGSGAHKCADSTTSVGRRSTDELRRSSANSVTNESELSDGEYNTEGGGGDGDDSEFSTSSMRSEPMPQLDGVSTRSLPLLSLSSHSATGATAMALATTTMPTTIAHSSSTPVTHTNTISSVSSSASGSGGSHGARVGVGLRGDIYSLGCVVQLMATGVSVFDHSISEFEVLDRTRRGLRCKPPNNIDRSLNQFLEATLQVEPSSRPKARNLRAFAFVRAATVPPEAAAINTSRRIARPKPTQIKLKSAVAAVALTTSTTLPTATAASATTTSSTASSLASSSRVINSLNNKSFKLDLSSLQTTSTSTATATSPTAKSNTTATTPTAPSATSPTLKSPRTSASETSTSPTLKSPRTSTSATLKSPRASTSSTAATTSPRTVVEPSTANAAETTSSSPRTSTASRSSTSPRTSDHSSQSLFAHLKHAITPTQHSRHNTITAAIDRYVPHYSLLSPPLLTQRLGDSNVAMRFLRTDEGEQVLLSDRVLKQRHWSLPKQYLLLMLTDQGRILLIDQEREILKWSYYVDQFDKFEAESTNEGASAGKIVTRLKHNDDVKTLLTTSVPATIWKEKYDEQLQDMQRQMNM